MVLGFQPIFAGSEQEKFVTIPAENVQHSTNLETIAQSPLSGNIVLPIGPCDGQQIIGIPDNNRTAIFPTKTLKFRDQVFAVAVKGIGARSAMFGEWIQHSSLRSNSSRTPIGFRNENTRLMTSECWYGEEPWGLLGRNCAKSAIEFTELMTDQFTINGFFVCPVLEIVEIPNKVLESLNVNNSYWYRQYSGIFFQEQRLVPSNIRLFHQSEITLGATPQGVLRLFKIESLEDLDSFIEKYITSGMAALTLFVRTLRPYKLGFQGLDFGDTWLDKDSIIAPDGTLYFVDLEDLVWCIVDEDQSLECRVHHQFNRNFYEFMFGLDILLREREGIAGKFLTQLERREDVAIRVELALARDKFLQCEKNQSCLDIYIKPSHNGLGQVHERIIDIRPRN